MRSRVPIVQRIETRICCCIVFTAVLFLTARGSLLDLVRNPNVTEAGIGSLLKRFCTYILAHAAHQGVPTVIGALYNIDIDIDMCNVQAPRN